MRTLKCYFNAETLTELNILTDETGSRVVPDLKDIETGSIDRTEIIDTTPPEFIAATLKEHRRRKNV